MSQRNYLGVQDYPVPVGTIIPVVGIYTQFNDGYLICNGITVNRTTWSKLFSVIGTTFGAGDGSTTFNIPNLTGRVPKGSTVAGGGGVSSFDAQVQYTIADSNMPSLQFDVANASFTAKLDTSSFENVSNTETPYEDTLSSIYGYRESSATMENAVSVSMSSIDVDYTGTATPQSATISATYVPPSYQMIYLIKGQESLGHQLI